MRIARNLGSSYLLYAASVISGLILTPVIIHAISKEGYGVWVFIGSVTIVLRLLDFGITPTVVRFTAFHRGRETGEEVDALASTSMAAYLVIGVVSTVAGLVIAYFLPDMIDLPDDLRQPAQVAAVIVAFTLGIQAPLGLFGTLLKGANRFDVLNAGGVLSIGIYALLVVVILTHGARCRCLRRSRSSPPLSCWRSRCSSSVASCPDYGCRALRSPGTASGACSASRGSRSSATSPARSSSRPT